MAIKFPLKFRGVDVRNIDDLRKNFDLNAAVEYFKDGRLLKWLEVRYYDDEAEKVAALDENTPDFREKLCDALGAEFDGENYSTRLEEKKNRLRELTDDKSIIDNAADTAFDQEDLSDLLDAGTRTIYLCGEKFSVPIRVRDKEYIGVLAAPTIKIRANSQADLDEKNIRFENVILPWDIADVEPVEEKIYQPVNATANYSRMKELRDTFEVIFGTRDIWAIVGGRGKSGKVSTDKLTLAEKKTLIQLVCGIEYNEDDIIHLRAMKNLSAGWAFTKDAFCVDGKLKDDVNTFSVILRKLHKIPQIESGNLKYSDITNIESSGERSYYELKIHFSAPVDDSPKKGKSRNMSIINRECYFWCRGSSNYQKNFFGEDVIYRIGKFLEFAKG
ncbi:MAG: hypothetical protein IJQ82_14575 [Selenomonadaceae bacterium]|nr:hypothetical protein [Selenomonadaceae bacterium]